jgi:hypothetical protein
MRRTAEFRPGLLASTVMLALSGVAPVAQADRAAAADIAYFEMTYGHRPGSEFVIALTDPAKIRHARDLLKGGTDDNPHVLGRIEKRPAPYNGRWSFHLRPETIDFFEQAIEVCDASTHYVEEHLDEAGGAFLPGLIWCPWDSRLTREVPAAG